ncbi:MAG TPA: condensation domain-containing protein, partial [Longimicrobiaceae bacterium]|nr:condensation domain-containing protein [Longimicrobiaceae bacterium]
MSETTPAQGTELLDQLTPAQRAVLIQHIARKRAAAAEVQGIPRRTADGLPPLSFAQPRLWLMDRLEPGSTAYNLPLALRLRGGLDARVLARTLDEVVRRHEALRTTFGEVGGVPVQVVRPAGEVPLPLADLSGLPEDARMVEALRLVEEEARHPFNLAQGPLLRALLLRLAPDDHVVSLAMHHIVSDGWSLEVLYGEMAALYQAFARGEPSPLAEPALQFADYAAWERAWLSGETLQRLVAYWAERLRGAPALLELPTDRSRRPGRSSRGAQRQLTLPRRLLDALHALARREEATLYMVVLAALDLLLARLAGQEEVVVGTPVAGRTRRETEGLVGLFVNTLA